MQVVKWDAKSFRLKILEMAYAGKSVHVPSALSIVEILTVLYRSHIRTATFSSPSVLTDDSLILSKGHGVMALYACLNNLGIVADSELANYFQDGTRLKGLADAKIPGIEATTGSLGHGLSVGIGIALARKLEGKDLRTYVVIGDGEMNEGSIWEALLFARHFKLDRLTVVVDINKFQAMGSTEEVLCLEDLTAKFNGFGFDTIRVDGHNEAQLNDAFSAQALRHDSRPKAVLADTVKGKGVSFMEGHNEWHYTRLSPEMFNRAKAEVIAGGLK